jgi:hypothetical protein
VRGPDASTLSIAAGIERTQSFGHDFLADAVAGNHGDPERCS